MNDQPKIDLNEILQDISLIESIEDRKWLFERLLRIYKQDFIDIGLDRLNKVLEDC